MFPPKHTAKVYSNLNLGNWFLDNRNILEKVIVTTQNHKKLNNNKINYTIKNKECQFSLVIVQYIIAHDL